MACPAAAAADSDAGTPLVEVTAAAASLPSGDLGTLSMPALALPAAKHLQFGAGTDYFRGGNFLLPGTAVQRWSFSLGAAWAPLPWLEAYGAFGASDAGRFGPSSRQTLSSVGDADLGVKFVLPRQGPLAVGGLLQLDIPAGVGSVSLKGTGGRAAVMASLSEKVPLPGGRSLPLVGTLLAGYVLDDSYNLLSTLATFPSYALALSLYDRVQGGLSIQSPLRYAAPVLELEIESPVARGQELPPGGHPARLEMMLGATAIHTGVPGLTARAGLALSLVRTGRAEADALPMPGWPPDPPWRAIVSLSYALDLRLLERKAPAFHLEPQAIAPPRQEAPAHAAPLLGQAVGTGLPIVATPTIATPPIPAGKGRIALLVVDSRTQAPLQNAWVSAVELNDLDAMTGADGRAQLDAPPGSLTLAVAHDGYDPFSASATVLEGQARDLTVALQPQLTDATVRGHIFGDDGKPLRASVELVALEGAGQPASGEPQIFEGVYSLALPHGSFNVVARAPGYRAEPVRVDVLPGEVASRDLRLHRNAGEGRARATPTRVELSERIGFRPGTAELLPGASAILSEAARALVDAGGPVTVGVRIEGSELSLGEDELTGLLLAEQRARAVADVLISQGVPRSLVQSHGLGIAKEGQPLLELKRSASGRGP